MNNQTPCGSIFDGVQESFDTDTKMELYPNPAVDYVTVTVKNNSGNRTYNIYNLFGKNVKKGKLSLSNEIAISDLATGVYIISVRDGEEEYRLKFVKIK